MQTLGQGDGNADLLRIAPLAVGGNDHLSRLGSLGHARHDELLRADDDRALGIAEHHGRPLGFRCRESAATDADFAAGQSERRIDRLDTGIAVHVSYGPSFHAFVLLPA